MNHLATEPPSPPWDLQGTAIALLHGWRSVLALVDYEASPVGPYDEVAVITLTRRGPSVMKMWVNTPASMIGGRRGWGFPKRLAPLRWQRQDQRIMFEAGKGKYRVRACGPSLPIRAHSWSVQVLDGRAVRVPLRVSGRIRIAWRGRQIVLLIESLVLSVLPPE